MLHIKITYFSDDLLSSLQVFKVSHFWSQVSQTSYCHIAYIMSLMTSQGHLKDTLKDGFKKERSSDEEYKYFSIEKTS
jgi:hypothetical protein